MNSDQIRLFGILALVFALLLWGRWRYDLVAFGALVVALLVGVVPVEDAFVGFGHPATVVVALVLIVSRGLSNSGVVEVVANYIIGGGRSLWQHITLMSGLAASLSALMNNVAALALLMPVDLQAAAKAERSPSTTLMALSFASILGGLVTLIGTPPNIVIATFRDDALGESYSMFDFTPVGSVCALVGVLFVTTIGWRLVPGSRQQQLGGTDVFELEDYIAELAVPDESEAVGKTLGEIEGDEEDESGVEIISLVRGRERLFARRFRLQAGDTIVVQGGPEAIEKFVGAHGLSFVDQETIDKAAERSPEADGESLLKRLSAGSRSMVEVVVPQGARIEGQTAASLRLLEAHDTLLLGISREGRSLHKRLRRARIRSGDILLLLGPEDTIQNVARQRLGCLPLAERGLKLVQRRKAGLAVAIFVAAIASASFGLVELPVALASVALLYVASGIVSPRRLYDAVEWPVIVLLASLIPIGEALEASGGTQLLAGGLVDLSEGYPSWVVLAVLMAVTMTFSDVMNNTATAVIAAPVAVDIAGRLDADPDPFLMAVAVAASCAFLTPIGHKNNTLIMGPGGYRFGDYWRMGLPLEVLIIAVGVPMILWVWPF